MAKKLGLIDGLVQWGIQRAAFAANTWKTQQLDTQDRQLVSMFLSNVSDGDPFTKLADDQKRRIAVTFSWKYSNIRQMGLICRTASRYATPDLLISEAQDLLNHW